MSNNFVSYGNAEALIEGINSKKVGKSDLTDIFATGTTNTTGSTITANTYFYLENDLVKALSDIAVNETFVEHTNYEVSDGALNETSGGGSGGHTIEDAAGNDLQQQDTMQFLGGLKATNDPTNGKTKIDDSPTLVTWAEWNAMTPEQRAAIPKAQITNVPGADGTISADVFKELWRNPSPTSNFASQQITLSSADYDFLLWLYKEQTSTHYHLSVISPKGAGTSLELSDIGASGNTNRIRRAVYVDNTHFNVGDGFVGSSSSYGSNSSVMIPVAVYGFKKTLSLNFSAIASDVSTLASKCMLSDGITSVGDLLDKGSVSVTADGVKTWATLLNELFALIDITKVNDHSYLSMHYSNGSNPIYLMGAHSASNIELSSIQAYCIEPMEIKASGSFLKRLTYANMSFGDLSSNKPAADTVLEFMY